jgi:septum site-determining protein MinC
LPIIRLLEADIEAVAAELGARVERAPEFFRNTPVVIDLSGFVPGGADVEFPLLVGLLRGYGMIPFGVRGGNKAQNAAAEAMELAILGEPETRGSRSERVDLPEEPAAPAPRPGRTPVEDEQAQPRRGAAGFTLVTRPVRSGQTIYAAGGDLSVVAPVSSGAELMADGNIHVYGPLRGRALAGLQGNTDARIFCQDLQAELISVAGHYRISENIPAELRGFPVQIFLDQKILRIEKL